VPESLPIAVLVSGAGTNLQALLETVHGREAQIVGVASSTAEAPALARAEGCGVPTKVFEQAAYETRLARDEAMADWLQKGRARVVVLAGYMELLSESFLKRFSSERTGPDGIGSEGFASDGLGSAVINVHPSLLPAFPGLHAIEQAIEYGVKVVGVTVHMVDAGVDTGPVILQRAIEMPATADPDEVLRALRPLEHTLLPEAVRLFARGAVRVDPENPRRVLVDGGILSDG
jgi:phosphoribosylglycinamide formyltransferase 1